MTNYSSGVYRPIAEVVESQYKMIDRLKEDGHKEEKDEAKEREQMALALNRHRDQVGTWVRRNGRLRALKVVYNDPVQNPGPQIERIVEFLGHDRLPDADKMQTAINTDLYRNRRISRIQS